MNQKKMDLYGVMGDPISHSYSPNIHHLFALQTNQNISYELFLVPPDDLENAIEVSLASPKKFTSNRLLYLNQLHPYRDGKSSERIIKTIQAVLDSKEHLYLKSKPKNWIRKFQIRRNFR